MATLTIYPSADTFAYAGDGNANYGTQSNLGIWHDGATEQMLTYIKFSMDSVPTSGVTAATFNIYKFSGNADSGVHLVDRVIGADWGELSLTYNNKPATTGYTSVANAASGAYLSVDVLSLVQNWKSGAWSNFGLAVRKGTLFGTFEFYSRESASDPYLSITYNSAPSAPTVTSPNGGEKLSGTHSITWTAATDSETAQGSLQYHIQISTNNGGAWSDIVALTSAGATTYGYDFSSQPNSEQCLIRIRAWDGTDFGSFDQSNAVFSINHQTHQMVI